MQFSKLFTFLASAALASANTVTFRSLDSTDRTIVFTPNFGLDHIEEINVAGGETVTVDFPHGWIGNWWSVCDGSDRKPGMLGEIAFNGWNGLTYFDVSAIVDPNDHTGVKEMFPLSAAHPVSGCKVFPCNNAYYLPDDVQTKTTPETDIVCTLGSNASNKRNVEPEEDEGQVFAHDLVLRGY